MTENTSAKKNYRQQPMARKKATATLDAADKKATAKATATSELNLPLKDILKERNIDQHIIDKFAKQKITSISGLRKLPLSELKKYSKRKGGTSFIDWKQMEALWSGDEIPKNYIPPIRKQCIDHGIDLEYADKFLNLGVSDLKSVTEAKLGEVMKLVSRDEKKTEGVTEEGTEGATEEGIDGATAEGAEAATEEGAEGATEGAEAATEEDSQGANEEGTEGADDGATEEGAGADMEDVIDSTIDDIRAAVGIVKAEYQEENRDDKADDDDNEKKIKKLLALQSLHESQLAQAQESVERANKMRESVKQVLDEMGTSTDKLRKENTDELKAKLESLKEQVKAPDSFAQVGKNFEGPDKLLAKLAMDSLFDTSTDHVKPYTSNKEMLAAASGGLALTGIGMFTDIDSPLIGCTMPVLAPPDHVVSLGVFTPFQSNILKTTSESEAAAFQSRASSIGMSMASSMATDASVDVSVSKLGMGVQSSVKNSSKKQETKTTENEEKEENETLVKTKTAQITEYIMMPMQSFRIPRTAVKLSEEAILELKTVTTVRKALSFFYQFGTHVSRGRHTLGGVFFRKMSLASDSQLSANSMFSAAGEQLSESKANSTEASVGVGANTGAYSVGVGVSASASFSNSSSMGSLQVSRDGTTTNTENCTYSYNTRCIGPSATSIEQFAKKLQENNALWACVDRGDPHSLMPIWDIVESEAMTINGRKIDEKTDDKKVVWDEKKWTNKAIAKLLEATWLRLLTPLQRAEWEANPSAKNLLSKSKFQDDLYKRLSSCILNFVGPITYNDEDKYKLIKTAVSESLLAMQDTGTTITSGSWITTFLNLGAEKARGTTDEQNLLFDEMVSEDENSAELNNEAKILAREFTGGDWNYFDSFFKDYANMHWARQQQAKQLIKGEGTRIQIFSSNKPMAITIQEVLDKTYNYFIQREPKITAKEEEDEKAWVRDVRRQTQSIFDVKRRGHNSISFKTQYYHGEKDKEYMLDFNTGKGNRAHIIEELKDEPNQDWLLYRPMERKMAPNEFILLNRGEKKWALHFESDDENAKLVSVPWLSPDLNNAFYFKNGEF